MRELERGWKLARHRGGFQEGPTGWARPRLSIQKERRALRGMRGSGLGEPRGESDGGVDSFLRSHGSHPCLLVSLQSAKAADVASLQLQGSAASWGELQFRARSSLWCVGTRREQLLQWAVEPPKGGSDRRQGSADRLDVATNGPLLLAQVEYLLVKPQPITVSDAIAPNDAWTIE